MAVVLVLALLSFWVLEFTKEVRLFQKEWGKEQDRKRAYQAALSGLEYSLFLLNSQKGEALDGSHRFGEGEFRYQVRNEEGKWDLNSLVDGDGNLIDHQAAGVARSLTLLGLDAEKVQIIHRLADWIDADLVARAQGGETGSYLGYDCRNVPMGSFSECWLLLDRDLRRAELLRKACTIYSSGKINLNTAPAVVLGALSDQMDESLVQAILDYRSRSRFDSVETLQKIAGMTDRVYHEIEDKLVDEGLYYSVWVEGKSGRTSIQVGAIVKKEENKLKLVWLKENLNEEDCFKWD